MVADSALAKVHAIEGERCPWCEQAIPHERFAEIQRKIRAKERARAEAIEKRLEEQHQLQLAAAARKAEADLEAFQKKSAVALANAQVATKQAVAAAREEAAKAVRSEMALQVQQAERAKSAAQRMLAKAKAEQDATLTARLAEQREALEKDKLKALNNERAKDFRERQKLEEKLQVLTRQLQKKTADELGEGAELDLFEELKAEFPSDDIVRVKRGEAGADIIHHVAVNGRASGCIVYDSKNRAAWRNDYVTKLRKDQLAAKAEHAILATRVFPAGNRQLQCHDGVIIANPARVVAIAHIIRAHIVQISTLRISNDQRAKKMARLYDFITSEQCGQLLDQIDSLSDDLLALDVKEKRAHDQTWRQRGEMIRSVQQARGQLVSEMHSIVGSAAATPITP
jgi:hypothetical protein